MSHSDDNSDTEPPRSHLRRGPAFSLIIERGLHGGRVPRRRLAHAVTRVARGERAAGELRLIVVDDRRMHELNRRFRRKDRPTDVLSFPEGESFPGENGTERIGEVYCNYDHARRWSRDEGGTVADELMRLAVHGALHLLGYDHHTEAERRIMAERENRYLSGAGLIGARGVKLNHVD